MKILENKAQVKTKCNLNATSRTYRRPPIWVKVRADEWESGSVRLTVQDNGPGVHPQDLELLRAFSPLEKSRKPHGTGLTALGGIISAVGTLFTVPSHPAREMELDLKRASVPKWKPGLGKLDFHAIRVAYVSFVLDSSASVKEAQTLARHLTGLEGNLACVASNPCSTDVQRFS